MSQPPSPNDNTPMAAVPLISFRPPPDIQRAIDARGVNWRVHAIEDATGPLNLDNYRVKILRYPSEKGLDSLEGLLKHIRLNINDFLNRDNVEFSPYSSADGSKWRSEYPVGAAMHIDFDGSGWLNLEDGSVVCSSYSNSHWIFSTISTLADWNHPVSGNRQFGYYMLSGPAVGVPGVGAYIYTRAADRVTDTLPNAIFRNTIFAGGHETWIDFQGRVARFVNSRGGKAEVLPPYSARHDWDKMKEFHKPTVEWIQEWRRPPAHPIREDQMRPR